MIFETETAFTLESGIQIPKLTLAYTTYGAMNERKNNVVWVFHALTANHEPAEWWPGMVGKGLCLDPGERFIVCVNVPGSCYGSSGPMAIDPTTDEPYFHRFPWFTMEDIVHAFQLLQKHLGIERIHLGIGASMGGQQLLTWAAMEPALFDRIAVIATNAKHSAWGIAFSATQRWCIENDPTWKENNAQAGTEGMKTARAIALLSYRNHLAYSLKQDGPTEETAHLPLRQWIYKSETYQRYQGEKLAKRFNAFSYYALTKTMDSHDIGRNRGGWETALAAIQSKVLVMGIKTDLLFPIEEQAAMTLHLTNAEFDTIDSLYGHDGFLLEDDQLTARINTFLGKA